MLIEESQNPSPQEEELLDNQEPKKDPPPPSPIKPEEDPKFLRNMAVEANRAAQREADRASQLENELNALKRKASGQEEEEVLPSKDEFYNDPARATAAVVKKMMKDAIAPLTEIAQGLVKKDNYTEMKMKYKNDPRFKAMFEKGEHIIDGVALKVKNLDESAFLGTLYQIRGAIASGDIELELDAVPKVEPVNGHLRPSSPPAPTPQKSKRRELSETEKREARRNNLTDDQYLDIMDTPDEVTFAHIDNALKEKK